MDDTAVSSTAEVEETNITPHNIFDHRAADGDTTDDIIVVPSGGSTTITTTTMTTTTTTVVTSSTGKGARVESSQVTMMTTTMAVVQSPHARIESASVFATTPKAL